MISNFAAARLLINGTAVHLLRVHGLNNVVVGTYGRWYTYSCRLKSPRMDSDPTMASKIHTFLSRRNRNDFFEGLWIM